MPTDDLVARLSAAGRRLEQLANSPARQQQQQTLDHLLAKMSQADFWASPQSGDVAKQAAGLQRRLAEYDRLQSLQLDLVGRAEISEADLEEFESSLTNFERSLSPPIPHAQADVFLSIHAGAGGTDAQDWVSHLLRMYQRWGESAGFKIEVLSQSAGDEAGLKSVDLEISGSGAYGRLVGEHGVHRLVRKSPFNSRGLRQTSFARVEVSPKIELKDGKQIDESDLRWDFFRSRGPGGQSVNTTDSAVRVTHLPTQTVVVIQNERSQHQNRQTALAVLEAKLAARRLEELESQLADIKGPTAANEWGSQIRNYIFDPYQLVKDLRTGYQTNDVKQVLDGKLDPLIEAYLRWRPTKTPPAANQKDRGE